MPNYETIAEALKALHLDESFSTLDAHYEKHTASNISELEKKLKDKDLIFFMPTKYEYEQAAKELADEDSADQNLTTVKTGIISFAGTQNTEYNADCIYKIRLKSNFISKDYLNSVLGSNYSFLLNNILEMYKTSFNTDEFCDVVIYKKDGKELTSDKTILTFYLAKKQRVESLIKQCNVYNDITKNTATENIKEQFLVIQHPTEKQSLEFVVVKPTRILSANKDRKDGVDNYTSYQTGIFFSPAKNEFVEFNLEGKINKNLKTNDDKQYAKASKIPSVAKNTFKLAAAKTIFEEENTGSDNFRQERYFKNMLSVWGSDINSIIAYIDNEPKIREYIKLKYHFDPSSDDERYNAILNNIKTYISAQWKQLDKYK